MKQLTPLQHDAAQQMSDCAQLICLLLLPGHHHLGAQEVEELLGNQKVVGMNPAPPDPTEVSPSRHCSPLLPMCRQPCSAASDIGVRRIVKHLDKRCHINAAHLPFRKDPLVLLLSGFPWSWKTWDSDAKSFCHPCLNLRVFFFFQ